MPHIPVGASKNFKGKSAYGPYGDTIEEIDWSTGQIIDTLKALGLDENTIIVYTSDNGPWIETTRGMKADAEAFIPANHSGLASPHKGWKMTSWEGGPKVPFIVRWPGKVKPNRVSDGLLTTMDLLPTLAQIAGAELPKDRTIDGKEAVSFLLGNTDKSPRIEYLYYTANMLNGIRVNQWKLVLPRPENPERTGWWGRMIDEVKTIQLFNLNEDPGETTNLAEANPNIVAKLKVRIEEARKELGDINVIGTGARFFDKAPRKLQTDTK